MVRLLIALVGSSALYGFAIGSAHSWLYAGRNLIKFPLLILTTAVVCAVAHFVLARFLAPRLGFRDVQRAVLLLFRDTSVMLAGLSPVSFFLALTMDPGAGADLGEYPFVQGFNVVLIAICGTMALVRQTRTLLRDHGLGRAIRTSIIIGWLSLSLFTGAQGAWYMRPFFGIPGRGTPPSPFFLGTTPDFRGARSFYEAVYNLFDPPAWPR